MTLAEYDSDIKIKACTYQISGERLQDQWSSGYVTTPRDKHDIFKDHRFCRREYYNRRLLLQVRFLLKTFNLTMSLFMQLTRLKYIIIYAEP